MHILKRLLNIRSIFSSYPDRLFSWLLPEGWWLMGGVE